MTETRLVEILDAHVVAAQVGRDRRALRLARADVEHALVQRAFDLAVFKVAVGQAGIGVM